MSTQQLYDLIRGQTTIKNILKGGTNEKKEPKKKKNNKKKVDFKLTNKLGIDKIPINMYKQDDNKIEIRNDGKSSLGHEGSYTWKKTSQISSPKWKWKWIKSLGFRKKKTPLIQEEIKRSKTPTGKEKLQYPSLYLTPKGKTPSWRKSSTKSQKAYFDNDEEVKI